jgi:ribosomal protein S18 acetylase RimI-like enzyme
VSPRLVVERTYGAARREGYKQLRAYNKNAVGKLDYKPLAITLRDKTKIAGLLTGYTAWGWLFVDTLWVSEEQRGKDMGKALLARAEAEARKRGARHAYLYSFSFQAPGFYRKLGYRQFGKLTGFPKGHSCHWLTKAL